MKKILCFSPWKLVCMSLVMLLVGPRVALPSQATSPAGAVGVTSPTLESAETGDGALRFNFRNVPLDEVLDHLGKTAGLVIVREVAVAGRVNAVSHKSLNRAQAVDLLNTILQPKGFAAVLNERTLKIVTLDEARKRGSPVIVGRDSNKIPQTAVMVTQIIPIRYAQAVQLIKNLEALLPSYAIISANEGSNALLLTATQTDIRRMVRIVEALDTSAQALSTIRVFRLDFADATDMAQMIGDLYKSGSGSTNSSGGGNAAGGMPMPPPMMPGMLGEEMTGGAGAAEASTGTPKRVVQVTALADTRSNSVVVAAPENLIPGIERLIGQMDISRAKAHEIRVIPLRHADAQTMAQVLSDIYQSGSNGSSRNSSSQGDAMRNMMLGGPGMGGPPGMGGFPGELASGSDSAAVSALDPPLIVADIRTNALVVNAEAQLVAQTVTLVARLDKDPAKNKKIYVYPLKYADPQKTAELLQGMFGTDGGSNSSSSRSSTQSAIFDNENDTNDNALSNTGRSRSGGSTGENGQSFGSR